MRAPFQVIVFPYRLRNGDLEVLIGKRRDGNYWQAISGGGEAGETLLEAAVRELKEESALSGTNWVKLDSMCTLPKVLYSGHEEWVEISYVVPEHAFITQAKGQERISNEHCELRWCSTSEATNLLKYDSNRNALWELTERLNA